MLQNLLLQVDKAIIALRHRDNEEGQALVEYALILFLVSVVAVEYQKVSVAAVTLAGMVTL